MRAREWTIAAAFGDPSEYDVPDLPSWRVERDDDGRVAFAATDRDEAFIAASRPVMVRR